MNWIKRVFNAKPAEEELKFQLALGKYVWNNKQEKIDALKKEAIVLNARIESLLKQLKSERELNVKMMSQRRIENEKPGKHSTAVVVGR
jgi:hypothetical protein